MKNAQQYISDLEKHQTHT